MRILVKNIFRLVGLVGLVGQAMVQELPQGYFRNPMDHDIALSATFAEFRTNHFHAGIDMRTGGEVDRPVRAAADGYVARVSISPWGGGKILYIKHPNGYTSVYMHLNGYAGEIGKAVLHEQYARQSYSISKTFAPDELPVKQGQLVAFSGNTGGSGGPHLHFELRSGGLDDLHTHSTTHNPLRFGLPYTDGIKPTLRGLRIYPEGGTPYEVPAGNAVTVDGPFHLGIYATDAAEGSTARNGVDHVEVFLDGTLVFMYVTDAFPVDSTRVVNALIDYRHYVSTRQPYLLTRALPGAEGPWVPVRQGDGIFRLKGGTTHRIGVRVYDVKGNYCERTVAVSVAERPATAPPAAHDATRYDRPFCRQHPLCTVAMPAGTLYADDSMALRITDGVPVAAPFVDFRPTLNDIPPHTAYTLSLKAKAPLGAQPEKVTVVRVDGKQMYAYATTHTDGWYTAQVRDFGSFTLAVDTTAPTVRPLNFSDGALLKVNVLKIKIGDNLSGIDTYHCYLNGEWILAEYDGKTATLVIDARGKLRAGRNELRAEVTDAAGNRTTCLWIITK